MRSDETKSSTGKSRQNLRNNYSSEICYKVDESPRGASPPELFKSKLDRAHQSTCHRYNSVLPLDELDNLVVRFCF